MKEDPTPIAINPYFLSETSVMMLQTWIF